MKLKLLDFIFNHPHDWRATLEAKPFSITVKETNDYYLLSYSQIDSDFSLDIVRECRGLILRKFDFKPVCVPFYKFFNAQESHAVEIDWSSARVQEKVDGSIIKLWWDNGSWHVSTNGMINAQDANLQMSALVNGEWVNTYFDLFMLAFPFDWNSTELDNWNKHYTYIFELVSPYNKVVVYHPQPKLYHIGTRDNVSLNEVEVNLGIEKPKQYNLSSLSDCLDAVEHFPFSDEGFVVVDNLYNRVKIKSPAYVAAHHLKNNGAVNDERILDIIRVNAHDDFLSIYPEYKELFERILSLLKTYEENVKTHMSEIPDLTIDRKSFAQWATKTVCPSYFFLVYDGKLENTKGSFYNWFWTLTSEKALRMIGA